MSCVYLACVISAIWLIVVLEIYTVEANRAVVTNTFAGKRNFIQDSRQTVQGQNMFGKWESL